MYRNGLNRITMGILMVGVCASPVALAQTPITFYGVDGSPCPGSDTVIVFTGQSSGVATACGGLTFPVQQVVAIRPQCDGTSRARVFDVVVLSQIEPVPPGTRVRSLFNDEPVQIECQGTLCADADVVFFASGGNCISYAAMADSQLTFSGLAD